MKNFAIQTNKENVNILKNGFYHRVPQASEYEKSECSKFFKFFETLEDEDKNRFSKYLVFFVTLDRKVFHVYFTYIFFIGAVLGSLTESHMRRKLDDYQTITGVDDSVITDLYRMIFKL